MKKVGIIGFGAFGQMMARHLVAAGVSVSVWDAVAKEDEAARLGATWAPMSTLCKNPVVLLSVPMEALEETVKRIAGLLSPGTLVMDVCSLKIFACKVMQDFLPDDVEVIATHPLFGPQSAKGSIQGKKIALVPVRATKKRFAKVERFCSEMGLEVLVTTADEHDRQMASSQALTHFIGQVCTKMGLERVQMTTLTFDDLMDIVDIVKNDAPALFENMQTMNPYAYDARERFLNACKALHHQWKPPAVL